jgi:hypothetical protein
VKRENGYKAEEKGELLFLKLRKEGADYGFTGL